MPVAGSRLAHVRDPELQSSGRAWAGARYITPGPSRTFSFYETPTVSVDPEVTRRLRDGNDYQRASYAVPQPAAVRPANIGSYFLSDPVVFQSYFKVHWEDMFGARADLAQGTRKLSPLANPNARGRAEGQPLQDYNPWPSASQLAPLYPGAELKAL